jgi:hypothetical protein
MAECVLLCRAGAALTASIRRLSSGCRRPQVPDADGDGDNRRFLEERSTRPYVERRPLGAGESRSRPPFQKTGLRRLAWPLLVDPIPQRVIQVPYLFINVEFT